MQVRDYNIRIARLLVIVGIAIVSLASALWISAIGYYLS